jgi:hypothetical protein
MSMSWWRRSLPVILVRGARVSLSGAATPNRLSLARGPRSARTVV